MKEYFLVTRKLKRVAGPFSSREMAEAARELHNKGFADKKHVHVHICSVIVR